MNRRSAAFTGVLALSLISSPVAAHAAVPASPATPGGVLRAAEDPGHALARLRVAARGTLRVQRDATGRVNHLASSSGRAVLPAPSGADTPREAVSGQLRTFGAAFGLDGTRSTAQVTQVLPSSTGGSIVRADQVVDGLPVFGGQVVTTLDKHDGVVSLNAATSSATEVPASRVGRDRARATALGLVARDHRVPKDGLQVVDQGEHLYDPALVHTDDPLGARPVWQFQVGNGSDIRETVLIGAVRGEVALHFNQVPELNRYVCDNAEAHMGSSSTAVPVCGTPARTETGPVSSVPDVNAAFDNLGAVADAYQQLDGKDLTALIGQGSGTGKALTATVQWCYSDQPCPFDNAFWDGTQMVFGQGYAGADDVVGHELTHGYVERTSNLFYFHQSGSLNESLADTIGEIVDHRHDPSGTEDNSGWTVGEDLGAPSLERSMKDPTVHDQPDTMTSSLYADNPIDDDSDNDLGDVHQNDGVGNKTAYLISQGTADLPGGTFHGHTIDGIDAGDPTLAKTGRLYLETIPALTSGSQYADLGTTLVATCQRLAAAGTGGFDASDCTSVSEAVAATELATAPTGGAPQAPVTCPTGRSVSLLARDDDGINQLGFTTTSNLWGRADGSVVPSYATSGSSSLFAFDPDPDLGDAVAGNLVSKAFTVPLSTAGTFLNFHHAYVFDAGAFGAGYTYYDGAQVLVQRLVNGSWTTVPLGGSAWVNGPDKSVVGSGSGFTGFAGDSQGYRSSQVALGSLAGQTVRFVFRVEGDSDFSQYGWWVDDVRLYACAQQPPSAPTRMSARASGTSAVLSWSAPASPGAGVSSYRVTRSDGATQIVPASTHSLTLTRFTGSSVVTLRVDAGAPDRTYGAASVATIYPTTTTLASSAAKVKKGKAFTLTSRTVRRGSNLSAVGVPLVLQRKVGSSWANVSSGSTGSRGTKAWSVKLTRTTSYRVVTRSVATWFASASGLRTVRKK